MKPIKYFVNLRFTLSVLRQLRQNVAYQVNSGSFWDSYVLEWELEKKNESLAYVGSEWANEKTFLEFLMKYSSTEEIALEIGCGGGRITSVGANLFKEVIATDVSDEMLRRSRQAIKNNNVSFHKIDGFTLDKFKGQNIGYIYSHDVFVHFPLPQVYSYLREIRDVLNSGGVGLISFFSLAKDLTTFKELSLKMWESRIYPPHMRVYFVTSEILELFLRDLGFEILEISVEDYLIIAFKK